MARVYVFAGEAGSFDFSAKGTRSFILGTVTMTDTSVGDELLERSARYLRGKASGLRRPSTRPRIPRWFATRSSGSSARLPFRADFTLFEKSKTVPHRQSRHGLSKLAWYEHFKHVAPKFCKSTDELCVVAASMGTQNKRREFRLAIEETPRLVMLR